MMRYLLLLVAMTGPAMAQDDGLLLWEKINEVFIRAARTATSDRITCQCGREQATGQRRDRTG
jgi:hypothetical protein